MNATDKTATKEAFATVVADVARKFIADGMPADEAVTAAVTAIVRKAAKEDREVFAMTVAAFFA